MSSSSRPDDPDGDTRTPLPGGLRPRHSAGSSAIAPVASYCFASILMTVVNKFVVSGRGFDMNFLLLCIQSAVCSTVVYSVKEAGVITFRDLDRKDAKAWFPVSFLLVTVIYTGSKSLQFLPIPIYTIFKNLSIILIAYGEVFWFGGHVTRLTFLAFVIMVLSSVVAAWTDVSSAGNTKSPVHTADDAAMNYVNMFRNLNVGYFWMLLNCLTSASYVLLMRIRIKATGFSDWDSMFYNNALSIPVLLVFSLLFENWSASNLIRNFPPETRNLLLFAIAFSGAAAVGISFTTAWCIRATSSTTYSMVGALNKLPVAASGIIFFGDPATFGSVTAIGLGFCAGLLYAVAKNEQKKAENASQSRPSANGIIPLTARK